MKKELQLSLDSFDPASPLRCREAPGQNAHKKICLLCVHAERKGHHIFCSRFRRPVTSDQKYSLTGWKSTRNSIRERDRHQCVICDSKDGLHIHHIDSDTTNDDPANLVTLCKFCHARAHTELLRAGGTARVMSVIDHYRGQRDRYTERTSNDDCR